MEILNYQLGRDITLNPVMKIDMRLLRDCQGESTTLVYKGECQKGKNFHHISVIFITPFPHSGINYPMVLLHGLALFLTWIVSACSMTRSAVPEPEFGPASSLSEFTV